MAGWERRERRRKDRRGELSKDGRSKRKKEREREK